MRNGNEFHDRVLTYAQLTGFLQDGFVRLEKAFSSEVADEARAILWRDTGCDPDQPSTWTQPVVWLGDYAQEPFRKAVNTEILHAAFDQLVGTGRWVPRTSLGSFPSGFLARTILVEPAGMLTRVFLQMGLQNRIWNGA